MVQCQYVVQQISNRLKFPILTKKPCFFFSLCFCECECVCVCFVLRIRKFWEKALNDQQILKKRAKTYFLSLIIGKNLSLYDQVLIIHIYIEIFLYRLVHYMTIYRLILAAFFAWLLNDFQMHEYSWLFDCVYFAALYYT
jgi:hypothetical protein